MTIRSTACVDAAPRSPPDRPTYAAPAALIAAAGNKAGMCFHLSVDEVDGSGFGPVPSRLRYALVHQETHHGIAQRPTQLFGHLDHGLPGAVQRARYMSLETMAPLSDNPTVSLPAIAA